LPLLWGFREACFLELRCLERPARSAIA
jgi:hypothetical protein